MLELSFEKLKNRFTDGESSWDIESEDRKINAGNILPFGIPCVDDILDGIEASDSIVIAAASGRGKTQTCTLIALSIAMAGHQVHYFALEAEDHEILRRMKFMCYSEEYWSDKDREHIIDFRYSQWRLCKFDHIFKKYDSAVKEKVRLPK